MKNIPQYHIRQLFFNGKLSSKSIAMTMNTFKNTYDFNILSDNLPEICRINEHLPRLIWGNLFPKSLEELGSSNYYYFQAKSEEAEINWVMVQVAKNRQKVQLFINHRDKVFNYILRGDYFNAENELEECRKHIGLSVWYYEMRLLIYGLTGRKSKIYEILDDVNHTAKESNNKSKMGLVPHLLQFLYLRSSENSVAYFDNELERLSKMARNSFQIDRLNYFKHRLNYYSTIEDVELKSPLVYEATNALVDRYCTLLTVLRSIFIKDCKKRMMVSATAAQLYKLSNDSQLLSLVAYRPDNMLPKDYYDNSFLEILNSYYGQQYEDVLKMCTQYILTNPCRLIYLRLYVQSLILNSKPYRHIIPGRDSLINVITKYLYDILTEQDNHTALIGLASLNKRLYGLPIAGEIHSFICEQSSINRQPLFDYVCLDSFDPLYSKVWETIEDKQFKGLALSYLEKGIENGLDGVAIEYYKSLIVGNDAPKGIAHYRIVRDKAIKDFQKGNYDSCMEACKSLLLQYPFSLSICQMATEYIFRCLEILEKKMEAITFYVEKFIERKSLTNRVNINGFVRKLRDEKYKGLRNNLDLQIFVLLNAEEDEQKAHVLEMFMDFKEIDNAKGLLEEMEDYGDQARKELFLSLLIEGDVMRHLSYMESTSQMLDEQQAIAQYLTTIESEWHDYYVEFNKQLLEQTLIYSNIEKLDESRIYVNEDALIKYDLIEFEKLYLQLSEIEKTTKQSPSILFIAVSKGSFIDITNPNIIGERIQTTKSPSMDVAIQLFDSICNKYLFSKFGLKTYLSTRIRHGVLEGELRSVFDSRNLVLLTEGKRYRPIEYWRRSFGLNDEEQRNLMNILADFSKNLLHTIENFKEEVVQIRTCEKEKGMLDFRIEEEVKCNLIFTAFHGTNNYKDFCVAVINGLHEVTELSLAKIRTKVRESLSNDFNRMLGVLENKLMVFSSKHFASDLQQSVSDSRAELQGKLVKIEKWFTLQSAKFDDFDLARLLRLVWDVTSRQYPNIHYKCKFEIDDAKIIIAARYYLLISDILTIIYNNIYNHGSTQLNDNVAIVAIRQDDNMLLHIQNRTLRPDAELNEDLRKKLESNRFQNEGGSGLAKVKNIVISELGGSKEDIEANAQGGICHVNIVLHIIKLIPNNENPIG